MSNIQYHRFEATLSVMTCANGEVKNVWIDVLDHEDTIEEKEMVKQARSWLKDHYGYCTIEEKGRHRKICNHKKMIRELHDLNCEACILGKEDL